MNLKDAFLGLCIVALLASEVFLFIANDRKNAALSQAQVAQHQKEQALAQLEQFKSDTVAQSLENAHLRSENQALSLKLSQLQTQASKLSSTNLLLTTELQALLDASQQQEQQQEQLQQAQAEQQAISDRNACIANLRAINAAKIAWAFENNPAANAVPTVQDLLPYFPNKTFPVCPDGGVYSINSLSAAPTCSVPGHVLPPQ